MNRCLPVFLVLVALPVTAQIPIDTEVSPVSIRGVVLGDGGDPVPRARVIIERWHPTETIERSHGSCDGRIVVKTDAAGGFDVGVGKLGTLLSVAVFAKGFEPLILDGVRPNDGAFEVHMNRGLQLRGVVRDTSGTAVPEARVSYLCEKGRLRYLVEASTDGQGRYRLDDLPYRPDLLRQNALLLKIWKAGFAPRVEYPRLASERVHGAARVWELDATLSRGGSIQGRVVNEANEPVEGAKVIVWGCRREGRVVDLTSKDSDQWTVVEGRSSKDGWYKLESVPLAPPISRFGPLHYIDTQRTGAYKRFHGGLLVLADGYDPQFSECPLPRSEGDLVDQPIQLAPASIVRGMVIGSDATPFSGAIVECAILDDPLVSELRLADVAFGSTRVRTDQGGAFEIRGLPRHGDSRLRFRVFATDGTNRSLWVRSSIRPGMVNDLGKVILHSDDHHSRLKGVVVTPEGEPVAGAVVAWVHSRGYFKLSRFNDLCEVTGPDGRFDLLPNRDPWQLLVVAPGRAVRLVPGFAESTSRQIVLQPEKRFEGKIVDSTGQAIPGAELYFASEARGVPALTGTSAFLSTDMKGRFEVRGLSSASGPVTFMSPASPGFVQVAGQPEVRAELTLNPGDHVYDVDSYTLRKPETAFQVLDAESGQAVVDGVDGRIFAQGVMGPMGGNMISLENSGNGILKGKGVPAGRVTLWLDASGYKSFRGAVTIPKGEGSVEIKMERGCTVDVQVSFAEERPPRGTCWVLCRSLEITEHEIELAPDSKGNLRIPLSETRWTIQAVVRTPDCERLMVSPIAVVDATVHRSHSVDLKLQGAERLVFHVADSTHRLRIVDSSGVIWFDRNALEGHQYSEGGFDDGFNIDLPRGEYEVVVIKDFHIGRRREIHRQKVVVPGESSLKIENR